MRKILTVLFGINIAINLFGIFGLAGSLERCVLDFNSIIVPVCVSLALIGLSCLGIKIVNPSFFD